MGRGAIPAYNGNGHTGGPWPGEGHAVIRTEEGGYVATGSITGSDGKTVLYAVMTDGSGNQLWDYRGEKETYEGNSILETADNGFVIAGSSGDRYGDGLLLLKLDSPGNKVWSKIFRIGQYGQANSVKQTSDGGFIVVGSVKSDDSSPTGWDAYILKTDDKGNEEWNGISKARRMILATISISCLTGLISLWDQPKVLVPVAKTSSC